MAKKKYIIKSSTQFIHTFRMDKLTARVAFELNSTGIQCEALVEDSRAQFLIENSNLFESGFILLSEEYKDGKTKKAQAAPNKPVLNASAGDGDNTGAGTEGTGDGSDSGNNTGGDNTGAGDGSKVFETAERDDVFAILKTANRRPTTFAGIKKAIEELNYSFPNIDFEAWEADFAK